ncbi:hypothetical protein [Hwanghaeella sp.]|uniref:hypothetical protein n=1 Tax=Hwanghaeella sp. TaxID=2605943 RepID=UPI003CCBFF84
MYFASLPIGGKRTWSKLSDASKRPFRRMATSMLDNPDSWIRMIPFGDHDPKVRQVLAAIKAEAAQGETGYDRGTPELRAKQNRTRKTDVFWNLIRDEKGRSSLNNHQANAGREIREIFEVISRKFEAPAIDPGKEPVDTSMGDYIPPLAQMPIVLEKAYHWRYLPWAVEARKRTYGRKRITAYAITVDIIVYNKPIRPLEKQYRIKHNGTVLKALRDSLTLYAELAGWIRPKAEGDS